MQQLLEGVHFLSGYSSLYAIVEECEKNDVLLAVSDGSVILHNMSYSWVVATPDGKILAWSAGPCNGRGNSFQAEFSGVKHKQQQVLEFFSAKKSCNE